MKKYAKVFLLCVFIASCSTQKTITLTDRSQLKFIGEYDIPHNQIFQNTTIGGLSGIDYDSRNKIYYLISDDRSSISPARFYSAKIFLNKEGIDTIHFISVNSLLQPGGSIYPNTKQNPFRTPDPEAIRFNKKTNQLVWSSEGERIVKKDTIVLEDPSVNIVYVDGTYIDSFALPANMHMQSFQQGPRQNGVFEGMSFIKNYKKLLVSVEEPLFEDGPRAGLNDSSAWTRIIKFDVKSHKPEAQYAYKIEAVAFPENPPGSFKINGVADILALNDYQLIVLERSFSTGRKPCTVKIYLADLINALDVSNVPSLGVSAIKFISKRLLLNMDDLGIYTDNIEGVTLGPKLSNGHQSIIFVADNNFSKDEVTQFLLFEIL